MTLVENLHQNHRRDIAVEEPTSRRRLGFTLSMELRIVLGILAVLGIWGLMIASFGVPALVWPMKVIVPSMIAGLVLLTRGLI